ncbi:MAG: S9 family peptidase [Candidatus Aminicenantes bacterium]|nr:S9 family peptidase [Candidatus Aminicenantes bacterium]
MKMKAPSFYLGNAVLFLALLGPGLLSAELPDLVPRDVLFGGGRGKMGFHLAADGRSLTYFAATPGGRMGLYRRATEGGEPVLVCDQAPLGRGLTWASDDRRYFYLRDKGGDENFHLWMFDTETKLGRDLTPFDGVKAQNLLVSPDRPNEILVGLNRRDGRLFDMHRVDMTTGEVRFDTENPGNVRWWAADRNLVVRAAVTCNIEDASMSLLVRAGAESPWRTLMTWPFGESGHLEGYGSEIVVGFSPDGRDLVLNAAFEGNQTSLALVDAQSGAVKNIIASDPNASVWTVMGPTLYNESQVLRHPKTGDVQAVGFCAAIPEWKVLDPDLEADFKTLRTLHPGVISINHRDKADRFWVVDYDDDDQPGAMYLYNRKTKTPLLLETTNTVLTKFTPASTKPVAFAARDGLEIPGYLTLPPGVEPKRLPLIVSLHGGPWSRDEWGFNSVNQWLANRGYAVLQVNFRGSAGFGKKFLNAGNGQWGVGTMQHDISDAVAWAVAEGIADPKRVGITGASYGGYATLAGLTFTPDLFACGVVLCGISNVKTFFETLPSWWGPILTRWIRRIGVDLSDETTVRRISPIYHAGRIKAPVLIFHGVNDPRTKFAEAEQIVKALRGLGREVEFIAFPDGGHGTWGAADTFEELARTEVFFAKHLGGRAEPYTPVPGSTAQVR